MENIMKMVFIYFYGRLTLTQNALQSNIKWVKIRNLSGWVAFHGILPSFWFKYSFLSDLIFKSIQSHQTLDAIENRLNTDQIGTRSKFT